MGMLARSTRDASSTPPYASGACDAFRHGVKQLVLAHGIESGRLSMASSATWALVRLRGRSIQPIHMHLPRRETLSIESTVYTGVMRENPGDDGGAK